MSEPGASDGKPAGAPSQFGCPDCGGVLWLADEDDLRFECRIGHAYTATSLAAAEDGRLEDALWAAVRMLEEQESLARRLIERQDGHDSDGTIHRLEHRLTRARERADVLRDFLLEPSNDRAGAILSGRTSAKLNRSATSV